MTSFGAILIAAPLSIAIGALPERARAARRSAGPIGSLVDMLAAVPSVVVGLWGILVLGPFMHTDVEPWLHSVLGWIPIFGGTPSQAGVLPAMLVLAIMATRSSRRSAASSSSASRATSRRPPIGLGATRWEMVRGVVVPQVKGGVVAGDHPRARPRARRGDRGHAGDRQRRPDPAHRSSSRATRSRASSRTSTRAPISPLERRLARSTSA